MKKCAGARVGAGPNTGVPADGCATHYENVCDVRADEKPRTLKVCIYGNHFSIG